MSYILFFAPSGSQKFQFQFFHMVVGSLLGYHQKTWSRTLIFAVKCNFLNWDYSPFFTLEYLSFLSRNDDCLLCFFHLSGLKEYRLFYSVFFWPNVKLLCILHSFAMVLSPTQYYWKLSLQTSQFFYRFEGLWLSWCYISGFFAVNFSKI